MAKSKTPAKKNTKTKAAPKVAPKAVKAAPKAPKAAKPTGSPRSATNGGTVPKDRYAKDPKAVANRLKEKTISLLTQAANAVVRAEKNGNVTPAVGKLQAAMEHLEAAKKALA